MSFVTTSAAAPTAAAPEEVGHEEEEEEEEVEGSFPPRAAPPPTITTSPASTASTAASTTSVTGMTTTSESTDTAAASVIPDTTNAGDDAEHSALVAEDSALAAEEYAAQEYAAAASSSSNSFDFKPVSVATLSSPWQYDDLSLECASCQTPFHPVFRRRHHCRLCGNVFCGPCTDQRALIPPSQIVLVPQGGKKVKSSDSNNNRSSNAHSHVSFTPDEDPDRMLTYLDPNHKTLLYGKGLEERFLLAREPLRVCQACHLQLQSLQEDLRVCNSNAMRFNSIDPGDARRLWNSPLAFTLGHEIRKAAYTLNNLLPLPKRRMGAFTSSSSNTTNNRMLGIHNTECRDQCSGVSPSLSNLDGVRIPARLLEQAKGVAVLTVAKGGLGVAGIEFGTGLVVARISSNSSTSGGESRWSAPSAIGTAGISWGALIGAQVSDHVFLLMTDASVELLFQQSSVTLGADVGIAVGPVGRSAEADLGVSAGGNNNGNNSNIRNNNSNITAPIYTYSLSKGLYAGISLDGKVIVTRNNVNEKFYGRPVTGVEILRGLVPTPPAAAPLYEALTRCHVYATSAFAMTPTSACTPTAGIGRSAMYPPPHQAFQYYPQQQQQQQLQPFPSYPQEPYQQQQQYNIYQQPYEQQQPYQPQQPQQHQQYFYQTTPTMAMLRDPDMGEYGEVVSSDNALLLGPPKSKQQQQQQQEQEQEEQRPPEETSNNDAAGGSSSSNKKNDDDNVYDVAMDGSSSSTDSKN